LGDVLNIEVIHNGVVFSNWKPTRKDNQKLQIINVGFVEARKNQKALISIGKELISQGVKDFHITVVGDGHELPMIKDLVLKEGLTDYFSFSGRITNLDDYLKKADIYIHTALNDNCPYSIVEAISNQLPVIAFKVGGIPEIISDEFLFPLNDYKSVVDFIKRNGQCLEEISAQQHKKIAKAFSLDHQFKRTKEVYLSCKFAAEDKVLLGV
jgi:glycosyltransferase involved in cell wall biosynthesis